MMLEDLIGGSEGFVDYPLEIGIGCVVGLAVVAQCFVETHWFGPSGPESNRQTLLKSYPFLCCAHIHKKRVGRAEGHRTLREHDTIFDSQHGQIGAEFVLPRSEE